MFYWWVTVTVLKLFIQYCNCSQLTSIDITTVAVQNHKVLITPAAVYIVINWMYIEVIVFEPTEGVHEWEDFLWWKDFECSKASAQQRSCNCLHFSTNTTLPYLRFKMTDLCEDTLTYADMPKTMRINTLSSINLLRCYITVVSLTSRWMQQTENVANNMWVCSCWFAGTCRCRYKWLLKRNTFSVQSEVFGRREVSWRNKREDVMILKGCYLPAH